MTNQEAVDIIKIAIAQVEWDYPMDYAAAFDVAVKALEKQEPRVLPTYMIYRNDEPINGGITPVDLCDECQRRFADWLRNAPDQGAGQ